MFQSKRVGPVAGAWLFQAHVTIFKVKLHRVLLLSTCSGGCRQKVMEPVRCTRDEGSSSTVFHGVFKVLSIYGEIHSFAICDKQSIEI